MLLLASPGVPPKREDESPAALITATLGDGVVSTSYPASSCDCTWALGGCHGSADGTICWDYCCEHQRLGPISSNGPVSSHGPISKAVHSLISMPSSFVHYVMVIEKM